MSFRFHYKLCSNWPPLAWVAQSRRAEQTIDVYHGPLVEVESDWFCEAVWDGPFAEGGIDQTDIIAGTGGRLREGSVTFVSSGSVVDRLQYIERDGQIWVSNSLAGLLRVAGETLAPGYRHYLRDLYSVLRGLPHYRRNLPASGGPVTLCYFENLVWDGQLCRAIAKPDSERRFESYSDFVEFLRRSMDSIAENMASPQRAKRYEFLGSLSKGYDSTTVTALAAPAGLRDVICFSSESGRDRGSELAPYFGVTPIEIGLNDWRNIDMAEVLFIAGNCFGDDVQFAPLRAQMYGKVFLSGFYGDMVWDRDTAYQDSEILRGDRSGGALTEFRLHAGFINCAVPCWGVRDAKSIQAISRSADLKPWDIGGNYSRPICRRIVESAGVPRDAFGQVKSFAGRRLVKDPDGLSDLSRQALVDWLGRHRSSLSLRTGLPHPLIGLAGERALLELCSSFSKILHRLPGAGKLNLQKLPVAGHLMNMDMLNLYHPPPVFGARQYIFPWAVEEVGRAYLDLD